MPYQAHAPFHITVDMTTVAAVIAPPVVLAASNGHTPAVFIDPSPPGTQALLSTFLI